MAHELLNPSRADFLLYNASIVYKANPLDKCRTQNNTWSRAAIATILKQEGNTYQSIGLFLNKDYTTVLYYVSHHKDNLFYDKEYARLFERFTKNLNNANNSKEFLMNSIVESVHHSTQTLLTLGYDWDFIEPYLKTCIESSRLKIAI